MKKAIFTVLVDNYLPELCKKTLPTIKAYADKIGADYILIKNRKYPDFPPTYEKMQIYELGQGYDFCLLIDADFIIDANAPDFTTGILPGYVGVLEAFDAGNLFLKDEYFIKDGRNIGLVSCLVLTDKETHKLWEPLDVPWSEARLRTKREFIIDEYCLSRNLAKYGFKFTGLNYSDEIKKLFYHIGATTPK
jgi:hypothetical protein